MKRLMYALIVTVLFSGPSVHAEEYLPPQRDGKGVIGGQSDEAWRKFTGEELQFSEVSSMATPPTGHWSLYTTSAGLFIEDDQGAATQLTAGSGDNTLDNAYDQGGAGSGAKINADSGTVEIEVSDGSNNGALLLDMDDSTNNPDVLTITNAGSGADIVAPSFSVTAGAVSATDGTFSGTLSAGVLSPTSISVGGTGSFQGNVTLDDGVGASPNLTLTDGSDETLVVSKADSGYATMTTLAADGVSVRTGNFTVGNGTAGTAAMDGEDAYIEGELEVDGAVQFDGAVTAASTLGVTGATTFSSTVGLSENVTFTMAADEYLLLDAATTDMTQTNGALDINFDSVTTGAEGINVKATMTAGGGGSEVIAAEVIDLDDDSDAAGTLIGLDINASDATGSSAIYGVRLGNALEQGINATNAAAAQTLVVDATTAAQTGTAGSVADIAFRTATDTAHAINLDVESDLTGAGEKTQGLKIVMDDDAANADNEIHAINIGTDGDATGLQHGVVVSGAGIDAALQADNGYIRVGTGSSPDQTPGDDDVFVEGTVEIDGNLYPDGNIIGDGATVIDGVLRDSTVSSGATVALTTADCGGVFYNDQATEFDLPADPTGCMMTFCVDNASNLVIDPNGTDRIWGATDANGDSLTSSTVGDCVTLVGTDADSLFVMSAYPASTDWPDTN